jgi:hypothetical protein
LSYYVLRNKHTIPEFLFVAVASWVVVLGGVTVILLVDWGLSSTMHFELLAVLPRFLRSFLNFCGAYAALGGICLWVTIWVYWIAVERGSVWARIGWFFTLLFTLHMGALIYAIVVWRTSITKFTGPQPLPGDPIVR